MVILQLAQFQKKSLVGIEQETVAEKNKDDLIIEGDTRSLNNSEATELKEWLKSSLAPKIKNIKVIYLKEMKHLFFIRYSDNLFF